MGVDVTVDVTVEWRGGVWKGRGRGRWKAWECVGSVLSSVRDEKN